MAAFVGPATASPSQRTVDGDISPDLPTPNLSSDLPNSSTVSPPVPRGDGSPPLSRPSYTAAAAGNIPSHARPAPVRTRWSFRSRPGARGSLTADHAISIDPSSYPYSNKDYIEAIKVATNPAQIYSFSRIQGSFQLYFRDASWARLPMPDARLVQCHPIGVPPVRVVVSDVPSHFDNGPLREMMSVYGTVVGPIKSLRASYQDPDLPNLQSFRRQIMMKFPSARAREELPSRLFVDFDDVPLTFFVSTEMRCHQCQGTGHVRDACPERAVLLPGVDSVVSSGSTIITPAAVSIAATDPPPAATVLPALDLSAISAVASGGLVTPLLDPHGFPLPRSYASSVSSLGAEAATLPPPDIPVSSGANPPGMVVLTKKRVMPSDVPIDQQRKLAKGGSQASSLGSRAEDFADDMDLDNSVSAAPPLSDSSLASLFDCMYRSSAPVLDHVRQYTDDPAALLSHLKGLRADKAKFKASSLSRLSTQAVYQYERKIRKALLEELSQSA